MPARTVLSALLIDALDEFERAIAAIPPPGLHRRIGRLNTPAWTVAHIASSFDAWLNVFVQRLPGDPWADDIFVRQRNLPPGAALEVALDEARAGFARAATRARPYLESIDATTLAEAAAMPPSPWTGASGAYLVARSIAHLFAHAGDLTVTASLAGAGDLGLPGRLAATGSAAEAAAAGGDGTVPALGRLVLDAREQFVRAAAALPRLAYGASFTRLNPGSVTVAHVASGVDRWWNVDRGGGERDPWLASVADDVRAGRSVDYEDALAAYLRVAARSEGAVAALIGGEGIAPGESGTGEPAPAIAVAAREAAHSFAHAGELAALGSLAGAGDLGLPGALTHSAEGSIRP